MRNVGFLIVLCLASVQAALLTASAQEASKPHPVTQIERYYDSLAIELDKRKLNDLINLANRVAGIQAEQAYRAVFDLAVHRGLYAVTEPAARDYLARKQANPETQALAGSIILISETDRGEYDKSLASLKTFLERHATASVPDDQRLDGPLVCAVGEAYLQRLLATGRVDIARSACQVAIEIPDPEPAVRTYFAERLTRFELIGKAAPAIVGKDLDGKPVSLADLKGKVVLVDFWASWCPPCVASVPRIRELLIAHKSQGFAVIGVNLDSLGVDQAGKPSDLKEIRSTVRWFLLHNRAAWPNLVAEEAEQIAKAYGVSEVPVNFLIGRDGRIERVELTGAALARAVTESLRSEPEK